MSQIVSVLNIGLAGCKMMNQTLEVVVKGILGRVNIFSITYAMSDTESTMIVALSGDVAPGAIYSLCEALNQEAIAYYNHEQSFGMLIGPKAEQWGKFFPALFLRPDGSRLSE